MSTSDLSPGQPSYYDPGEVEAYIRDATSAIAALQFRLHEAVSRAEETEQLLADRQPETAGLGRALLLASEVADKTISEADGRAAEIVREAENRAAQVIQLASAEASRLVDAARCAMTDLFHTGEAHLLGVVSAFIEGSNQLRAELARIEQDATNGYKPNQQPRPFEASTFMHVPSSTPAGVVDTEDHRARRPAHPDLAGGSDNSVSSEDDADCLGSSVTTLAEVKVAPFSPPRPSYVASHDRRAGDRA